MCKNEEEEGEDNNKEEMTLRFRIVWLCLLEDISLCCIQ